MEYTYKSKKTGREVTFDPDKLDDRFQTYGDMLLEENSEDLDDLTKKFEANDKELLDRRLGLVEKYNHIITSIAYAESEEIDAEIAALRSEYARKARDISRGELIALHRGGKNMPQGEVDGIRSKISQKEWEAQHRLRRMYGALWSCYFKFGLLRGVVMNLARKSLEEFLCSPEGEFVTSLRSAMDSVFPDNEGVRSSLWADGLQRITRLSLAKNYLHDEGINSLVRSPKLVNLQALDLRDNVISTRGIRILADSDLVSNLEDLSLFRNGIGSEGINALATSDKLGKLKRLNLCKTEGGVSPDDEDKLDSLEEIIISMGDVTPSQLRDLANSHHYKNLKVLKLEKMPVLEGAPDDEYNAVKPMLEDRGISLKWYYAGQQVDFNG